LSRKYFDALIEQKKRRRIWLAVLQTFSWGVDWKIASRQHQGCQIILGTTYQNGGKYAKCPQNIQNGHKLYQHCPLQDLRKFTQIGIFGSKIYIIWQTRAARGQLFMIQAPFRKKCDKAE
jgi:hypothetical protein